MHQLNNILLFALMLQVSFFTLEAGFEQLDKSCCKHKKHHCDQHGPAGRKGPTGPVGDPNMGFGNYASLYLTTGSAGVNAGDNVLFNSQVTLSGIEYDNATGLFTLSPGTYAVTYFFAPFSTPAVNMYANGQLILNSPLGGNSTVLTFTEPTNTLSLQYIAPGSFSAPGANQSWVSIAIFQID